MAHLSDVLADLLDTPSVRLRTATVDAVSTGPNRVTITLGGGSVPDVPYLASYTPTVGNVVSVLQTTTGQLLVIGRTA